MSRFFASAGKSLLAAGRWLFAQRASVLLALVYTCVAYLGFSAVSDYTNRHHLFPYPWGGYAMAIFVDGMLLFAFISFRKAPRLAGLLLLAAAVTTYTLQRWHAELVAGAQHAWHPLILAGIVPGGLVLATWAWHHIRPLPDEGHTEREVPPRTLTRERVAGHVLTAERPKLPLPETANQPKTNGALSPRARAMEVLRADPTADTKTVAQRARVSLRTVGYARQDLKGAGQ